jgi:glycosyltransferase involved in cell wall biosynthesis
MSGLVSIIMPAYNASQFISVAIKSVLAQTYENWELIIVDDCSTDNTEEVILSFNEKRIRLLKNRENSGAAVSRNWALREARGRWIAFLDSDDSWVPEKLEKQISFMETNNYKFTFTDYRIIASDGTPYNYRCIGPKKVNKLRMYCYCYFSTITVMYEREAIGLVQIADIKKNNDYAMWFKVVEKANAHRLPECLSIVHERRGSLTSGSKLKLIKYHYIMFRKALNKGVVASFFFTGVNLFFGAIKKCFYRAPL